MALGVSSCREHLLSDLEMQRFIVQGFLTLPPPASLAPSLHASIRASALAAGPCAAGNNLLVEVSPRRIALPSVARLIPCLPCLPCVPARVPPINHPHSPRHSRLCPLFCRILLHTCHEIADLNKGAGDADGARVSRAGRCTQEPSRRLLYPSPQVCAYLRMAACLRCTHGCARAGYARVW